MTGSAIRVAALSLRTHAAGPCSRHVVVRIRAGIGPRHTLMSPRGQAPYVVHREQSDAGMAPDRTLLGRVWRYWRNARCGHLWLGEADAGPPPEGRVSTSEVRRSIYRVDRSGSPTREHAPPGDRSRSVVCLFRLREKRRVLG